MDSKAPQLSQSRKKGILDEVQKQRRRRAVTTIVVVVSLIAVIVVGIYALTRNPGSALPPYLDICVSGAGRFYHAHAHLSIVINGNPQTVSAGIGIQGGCLRPLHTHATDGVIHVEPDDGSHPDYSLKDFFLIWGQVLNSTQILGFKTDSTHSITLTVNGSPVPGAPESYQFPRNSATPNETCSTAPCQQTDIVITYSPSTSSS